MHIVTKKKNLAAVYRGASRIHSSVTDQQVLRESIGTQLL
jgi:hypothetical protein